MIEVGFEAMVWLCFSIAVVSALVSSGLLILVALWKTTLKDPLTYDELMAVVEDYLPKKTEPHQGDEAGCGEEGGITEPTLKNLLTAVEKLKKMGATVEFSYSIGANSEDGEPHSEIVTTEEPKPNKPIKKEAKK